MNIKDPLPDTKLSEESGFLCSKLVGRISEVMAPESTRNTLPVYRSIIKRHADSDVCKCKQLISDKSFLLLAALELTQYVEVEARNHLQLLKKSDEI